ncbi:phage protein GemA/Gp16 family protein, partial [Halomonas sp.]
MELYPGKKRLLQVARRQLALSDQQWRDLLEAETGSRSTRDIDLTGFEAVMERLKKLGFESTHSSGDYGHRAGMATPNQ